MHTGQRYGSSRPCCLPGILAILLSALVGGPAAATEDDSIWTTDAEAAVRQAQAENKDLLLLFTGSDWCPPCIRLEEQVLGQAEFGPAALTDFVLVKFDFPQSTELPPALQQQNARWSDRYGIEGFPTVVLADAAGRPYAFTGFRDEGPTPYLAHLGELQQSRIKRDTALEKAAAASGLERARLLDEALSAMDSSIAPVYYADLVEEIGQLDEDDQGGLRTKYFAQRDREMRQAIMSDIDMVARLQQPEIAIAFIDATVAQTRLPVDMWLVAQQTKLRLLRKLQRADEANALSREMTSIEGIDPDVRQRLVNNKAFYLASLGRPDEAFALLEEQIASQAENLLMTIAVGDLHDSRGQLNEAIAAYDRAIMAAAGRPDILLEVIEAKADALYEMERVEDALQTLDSLIDNPDIPPALRGQALLHKALFLRESGRRRAAMLSENRAVELVESASEKGEIQKLVDQFRRRFEGAERDRQSP